MIVCRKCGQENAADETFCVNCGSFLEWTGENVPTDAVPPARSPQHVADRQTTLHAPQFDVLIADLEPDDLEVAPGGQVVAAIRVRLGGSVVDTVAFAVEGLTTINSSIQPASLNLYPGTEGTAQVVFSAPRRSTVSAGIHAFGLLISSREHPESTILLPGRLVVGAFEAIAAELRPSRARGIRMGRFEITIRNDGNRPARLRPTATDPDGLLEVVVRPDDVLIGLGEVASLRVVARARRMSILGSAEDRPFTVALMPPVETGEVARAVSELRATFSQSPLIPTWLAGVAAALVVAVIGYAVATGGGPDASSSPVAPGSPSAQSNSSIQPSSEPPVSEAPVSEPPEPQLTVVSSVCFGAACPAVEALGPIAPPDHLGRMLVSFSFSQPINPERLFPDETFQIDAIGAAEVFAISGQRYMSGDRQTVLWVSTDSLETIAAEAGGIATARFILIPENGQLIDDAGQLVDGDGDLVPGGTYRYEGPYGG